VVRIGKALEMFAFVCMLAISSGGDNGGMSRKGLLTLVYIWVGRVIVGVLMYPLLFELVASFQTVQ